MAASITHDTTFSRTGTDADATTAWGNEHTVTGVVLSVNGQSDVVVLTATDVGAITDAPSDGNQYARKNGAWEQVVAGGGTKGQVLVDFGSIPKEAAEFTVTSTNCTASSIVTASMAYEDTADNYADEIEMSKIVASAGQPAIGSFKLLVNAFDGCVAGTFKVNYAY